MYPAWDITLKGKVWRHSGKMILLFISLCLCSEEVRRTLLMHALHIITMKRPQLLELGFWFVRKQSAIEKSAPFCASEESVTRYLEGRFAIDFCVALSFHRVRMRREEWWSEILLKIRTWSLRKYCRTLKPRYNYLFRPVGGKLRLPPLLFSLKISFFSHGRKSALFLPLFEI